MKPSQPASHFIDLSEINNKQLAVNEAVKAVKCLGQVYEILIGDPNPRLS